MSSRIGLLAAVFGELLFIAWGARELWMLRAEKKKPKDDDADPKSED